MLVESTDTTTNLLGNTLRVFLDNPEFIQFLQFEPHAFIEEALRYEGPVLSLRVTQDVELDEIILRKNNQIFPLLASVNHDETSS